MTRYAVGDIQGCLDPLLCLLEGVNFDPTKDELWSVGDLVNRGPKSLETLRFFHGLGDATKIVLGNHDLHLLAVHHGAARAKRKDTLQGILEAEDRQPLMEWLQSQPLMRMDPKGAFCMVHAGIPPQWSTAKALQLADEVQQFLQSPRFLDYFNAMYGNTPERWSDALQGTDRLRVITNYLTRMRLCDDQGGLELTYKGTPEEAPKNLSPWYELPPHEPRKETIIFGHWAALMGGASSNNQMRALDTGCVWGEHLTLIDLDSEKRWNCNCDTK